MAKIKEISGNRLIAKNTILLYVRMFILMGVNLYTSRVLINALGVENFGIYGIVGGVVVLFSFLNSSLVDSTNRFISFELGRNNEKGANQMFSASLLIHLLLIIIIIILSETIGLWILNKYLNIPTSKMYAANWVYQFSIITFCFNVIRIPYNSCIISYEKMNFYAILSILEAILKLAIVYILLIGDADRLILYAELVAVVAFIILICYITYCLKSFSISRFVLFKNSKVYKEMLCFSGWNMFTGIANMGSNIGVNMLINIFCGVTINAAVSVANQVTNALYMFISNFQIAFNPQIIKLYASDRHEEFYTLVYRASKFSYYLFLVLCIPIFFSTESILKIWLGIVPTYTSDFIRLILIYLLIDSLSLPLVFSVQASGKIKWHEVVNSIFVLSNFAWAYLILFMNYPAYYVWGVRIFINMITAIYRLFYLRKVINFSIGEYVKKVVFKVLIISVLCLILPFFVSTIKYNSPFVHIGFVTLSSIISSFIFIYGLGLDKSEKNVMCHLVSKIVNRNNKDFH